MKLKELWRHLNNEISTKKLRGNFYKKKEGIVIIHPFDLFKMRYANKLEVSFNGGSYIIEEIKGVWFVYNYERNVIFDKKEFSTEDDACNHLNELMKDYFTSLRRNR